MGVKGRRDEGVFKIWLNQLFPLRARFQHTLAISFHALIVFPATFPLSVPLPLPPNTRQATTPPSNERFVPSFRSPSPLTSTIHPLTRPFDWIHSSSISEPYSQLWYPHPCGRGLSRRPRWLAPSRTVPLLPSSALPLQGACQPQPLTLTSHTPSSKVSRSLSFFPLRDSYGTTQLVVHTPPGSPPTDGDAQQSNLLTELARTPVESTVLVQGHVRLRPEKQRRPVINTPYSFRLSDD